MCVTPSNLLFTPTQFKTSMETAQSEAEKTCQSARRLEDELEKAKKAAENDVACTAKDSSPFGWIYLVRYLSSMRPSSINIIFVHLVTMTMWRIHTVCSFHVFWDARTELASSLLSDPTPSSHK